MISTFIQHELKAFWRSKNTGKSIAIRVVMGIFIVYLFGNVLLIGSFLDKFLGAMFPHEDLLVSFCGLILGYFLVDVVLRLQLQELPTLRVQPYLQLPIKRNTVVGYLAFTSLLSIFNIWPFLLFFPFIIKIIAADNGWTVASSFMLSIVSLSVFSNYLALYIKRKSNLNGWVFLMVMAVLALVGLSDFYWHLFSIKHISYSFFGRLVTQPFLFVFPLFLGVVMFYVNFLYLKQNLYLEELGSRKASAHKSSTDYPFLARFGNIGDLVANEIKLIVRNKRSRSALIMGTMFMAYGLIFYPNPLYKGDYIKIFVGMFMTGIFIINYGQFMFAWQAAHFDGMLTSKMKITDFIKAKYLLFTLISTGFFLLTLPYAYFGWRVVMIHFVMYLWNLGVNTTIVLFFANRNYKRIDLSKGAAFNWEGMSGNQWIMTLPLMLAPFIVYTPFALFGYGNIALALLAATGAVFVLTRSYWIKKLEEDFYTKRYTIAEGFRNK